MMSQLLTWSTGLSALYLVSLAFAIQTKNLQSALVFKVIPFLLGVALLVIFLKTVEIL